jgi:hypothetical protein
MSLLLLFNQSSVASPVQEAFEEFMTFLHLDDLRAFGSTEAPVAHLSHVDSSTFSTEDNQSILSSKQEQTSLVTTQSDAKLLEKENISIMHIERKETYVG